MLISAGFYLFVSGIFSEFDLVEKLGSSTLNWTKGVIELSLSEEVEVREGESMADAVYRTEESLSRELVTTVGKDVLKLRYDSVSTVENIVESNPELKYKLGFAVRSGKFSDYFIRGGRMYKSFSVNLFGPKGILKAIIGKINENLSGWEKYRNYAIGNEYAPDVVIIDATFSGFSPSLTTRIYDQSYSLICGPETSVSKVEDGFPYLKYSSSLLGTLKSLKKGSRVLYIIPLKSDGPKRSNLILFNEDVRKMLKVGNSGEIVLPEIYIVVGKKKGS